MNKMNPLILADMYKMGHYKMYPRNTLKIYSNLTPRKSRFQYIDKIVFFGLQYFIKEYLQKQWNANFFNKPKAEVIARYKRMMDCTLGPDSVDTKHIEDLHDLGYLPLKIKAFPEGTLVDIRVPVLTITNTVDHAYWLVNFLETILSTTIWQPSTSATIAYQYKKLLSKYALETVGDTSFVQWQAHDFSMRGMSSLESACTSGAGHLLSFTGTDTIPAIAFLEDYYKANVEKELVGASVPATEHSVMCLGEKDGELETFRRLLQDFPKGILSVVSDTWDLWKVCTEYVTELKDLIMSREGKLVIRPDSGVPEDIICGKKEYDRGPGGNYDQLINPDAPSTKGVIELLWDAFGGTISPQGYKVLDPHIGAIYGDSITLERAEEICERLKAKGFASTNVVLGVGSYTYQYNTRDTFGFAMKATYGEVMEDLDDGIEIVQSRTCREIFKDPVTDDGTKKSAKGLIEVVEVLAPDSLGHLHHSKYELHDRVSAKDENSGELKVVFEDGVLIYDQSLAEIRSRLNNF